MFCRTHKSFGIESLEKRELLAADLLAMDRLDPDGTDQTIQNVCQIEAKMLTVSDPTANGPTVDPFGTDSVQFQTATGEEPDGTRHIKPLGVDDAVIATIDQTTNGPTVDPFGTDSMQFQTATGEEPDGTRRIKPLGVDDTVIATIDQTTNGPTVDPFGTDSVQFQTATGEEPDGTRRIKPHDVDDTLATYETGDGRVDPMTYLEA